MVFECIELAIFHQNLPNNLSRSFVGNVCYINAGIMQGRKNVLAQFGTDSTDTAVLICYRIQQVNHR
jgi:hypothetical protein